MTEPTHDAHLPEPARGPQIDARWAWLVAALAVAAAVFQFFYLRTDHVRRAEALLDTFVVHLHEGDDQDALALLSERYRARHDVEDLRLAVAALSELRSASGATLLAPTSARWRGRAPPTRLCGRLLGLPEQPLVALGIHWGEEGPRLDALAIGGRQLDPDMHASIQACRRQEGR